MEQLPAKRPATSDSLKATPVEVTRIVGKALTFRNLREEGRRPVELSERARSEINAAIRTYSERLIPCSKAWLLEQLTTLLGLYWTNANDERQREATLRVWIDDLCEYPAWALFQVFRDWRQNEEYAPKINQIRGRVREMIETDTRRRDHLTEVLAVAVDLVPEANQPGPRRRPDRLDGSHGPRPDSPFFYARPENIPPEHDIEAKKIWARNLVEEVMGSLKGPQVGGITEALNKTI